MYFVFERMLHGLCNEYTWVFVYFDFFFLHWYLGDFMKIMFYGHHSKTKKKKIVCLASLALALAVAQSETVICDSL